MLIVEVHLMFKRTHFTLIVLFLATWFFSTPAGAEARKGEAMEKLSILIDGEQVTFASPPVLKDDRWLVPLESFSKHIGAKVEYPQGAEMAVVCQADRCVSLKFGDITRGALQMDGIVYASPAAIAEPFGFHIQTKSPNQMEIFKGGIKMAGTGNTAGQLAPDFTLPDLNGNPRKLSDFRGKKTLLYLWASW